MLDPYEPVSISPDYLAVRVQTRYRNCNLSCPYCITRNIRKDLFDLDVFRTILARIQELPRHVSLHLGIEGEIFTSEQIMREVSRLTKSGTNLLGVSFLSNITASWERVIGPFLDSVDCSRLGMGCTLHDLVIDNVEQFFLKVESIRRRGVAVYVTIVAIPGRIAKLEEYRQRCHDIGVPFVPNALIGSVQGLDGVDAARLYPRDYTADEVRRMRAIWETPHSFKMLVEGCPPCGMLCSAGRAYVFVDPQGNVYPCSKIKETLGSLLRGDVVLREADVVCPSDRCWCGNQNHALCLVDRHYRRTRNIRLLQPRPEVPESTLYEGYNASPFRNGSN